MNKSILMNAVMFTIGIISGGATTYIYCKKTEEARIETEVKSVREAYEKASKTPNSKDDEKNDHSIKNTEDKSENAFKLAQKGPEEILATRKKCTDIVKTNYGGFYGDRSSSDIREQILQDIMDSDTPDEPDMPYVMTDDMVANDDYSDDMTFLTYYMGDQVLADDANLEPMDIRQSIGYEIIDKFAQSNAVEIFVKDPRIDILYDITKDDGSYADMMETYHGGI